MGKITKRWLVGVVSLLVLAGTVYGLLALAVDLYYYPSAPEADYPEPANPVEARRQDLDYFRHYLELDRSYTEETRAAAEALLADMEGQLGEYSDAGFQLAIARAVALADNGHSNIWIGRFSRQHGRLPLRFYWFADGPFVVRARADHGDLLGARLLAVNGTPLQDAAKALKPFVGGTWPAFRAYRGPIMLELPAAHAAAGLGESETGSELTFRLPDGSIETRRLEAESLDEESPLLWSHSYLYATPPEIEPEPWVGLADRVEQLPDYLADSDQAFRWQWLPGEGLYIQYRDNYSDGIAEFEQAIREQVALSPPAYIVLDERFNGGGDYTKTADLMFDLPGLVANNGPVYVLTGPATFSAGISSVAFVKSAGSERVLILGERVGDRERVYGETNDFELPNSKLGMTFTTGLHDVADGCPPFPQCYYLNYFHDVAVGSLDPDIPVATRFADYMAGIDPVLDTALALER